jgi:hypothetical protein
VGSFEPEFSYHHTVPTDVDRLEMTAVAELRRFEEIPKETARLIYTFQLLLCLERRRKREKRMFLKERNEVSNEKLE